MENPNKLSLTLINGSFFPVLYNNNNEQHTEINQFIGNLAEQNYAFSTMRSFARMLSLFLWYCSLVDLNYLNIKDLKDNFKNVLQGFGIWLGEDGKRSQKRITKIIQIVLWFYRFHYTKLGNTEYLVYLDTLIDECRISGIILRRGLTVLDKSSKLRPDNVDAMVGASNCLRDILLIRLVIGLGLRPSEVIRLRWVDLSYTNKHICIAGPPAKTFILSGYRIVLLSQNILELFRQYQEELINNGHLFEYVFVSRVGSPTPIKYDTVMSLFRSLSIKTQKNRLKLISKGENLCLNRQIN